VVATTIFHYDRYMGAMSRLLERDRELLEIDHTLTAVLAGTGRVLLLEGPPGVGKTSLIEAACKLASAQGALVLRATAAALEEDLSWGVVRSALSGQLVDPRRRQVLLSGAAAAAAPLFTSATSPEGPDAIGAILHGLYWLISDLAAARQVAVVIDDAHWVDAPSARWLGHLAARVAELPVALVIAARPAAASKAFWSTIAAARTTRLLSLQPLSRDATRTLVAGSITEAEPAVADACHEATAGNPFLLGELLRQVGSLPATRLNPEQIRGLRPDSIRRSVLLRLAQLDSRARELCFAIAVLGQAATSSLAAQLVSLGSEAAAVAVGELEGADVIRTRPQLAFVHPLVLDIVEREMPAPRRDALHRAATELLAAQGAPPETLAPHLLATEPGSRRAVPSTLRAAAAGALATGAPENAVAYLRRALAEPPPESELTGVLVELGQAEGMLGDPAGVDRLRQALARSRDPRERGLIAGALGGLLAVIGELQEMISLCHTAAAELPESERELRLRLLAHARTAAAQTLTGLPAEPPGVTMAELRGETPGERVLLAAVANTGTRTSETNMSVLCEMAERALGGTALLNDVGAESPQFWAATTTLMFGDRYDEAERLIALASADSSRRGSPRGYALCVAFGSSLLYRLGKLRECAEDARAASELLAGEPLVRAYALSFLLDALIDQGALAEARLAISDEGLDELPLTAAFSLLRVGRARLWRAEGDYAAALRELTVLDAALGDFSPVFSPWRAEIALALHAAGDSERAREVAVGEVHRSERVGSRWAGARALHALGVVTGTVEPLEQADVMTRGMPIRLERSRVLVELGGALRRRGRSRDAQPPLREGLDLADRCGAVLLASRAREELLAVGARPRRSRISGRDALTASELRVCRMAADGASNREIAQALFVGLRTVETHLTRAYDKLGIAGRDGLADALSGRTATR
jgi:DNA-binding CsgD family transcriptional regulator